MFIYKKKKTLLTYPLFNFSIKNQVNLWYLRKINAQNDKKLTGETQ